MHITAMQFVGLIVLVIAAAYAMATAIVGVPLTGEYEAHFQGNEPEFDDPICVTGVTIYKDSLVVLVTASGLIQKAADASGTVFSGVAWASTVPPDSMVIGNTVAGQRLRVRKSGAYWFNPPTGVTFTQAMVGQEVLVNSDNQVTVTAGNITNTIKCGRSVDVDLVNNKLKVRIDGYCY